MQCWLVYESQQLLHSSAHKMPPLVWWPALDSETLSLQYFNTCTIIIWAKFCRMQNYFASYISVVSVKHIMYVCVSFDRCLLSGTKVSWNHSWLKSLATFLSSTTPTARHLLTRYSTQLDRYRTLSLDRWSITCISFSGVILPVPVVWAKWLK